MHRSLEFVLFYFDEHNATEVTAAFHEVDLRMLKEDNLEVEAVGPLLYRIPKNIERAQGNEKSTLISY
jgi:hypothetical protein